MKGEAMTMTGTRRAMRADIGNGRPTVPQGKSHRVGKVQAVQRSCACLMQFEDFLNEGRKIIPSKWVDTDKNFHLIGSRDYMPSELWKL